MVKVFWVSLVVYIVLVVFLVLDVLGKRFICILSSGVRMLLLCWVKLICFNVMVINFEFEVVNVLVMIWWLENFLVLVNSLDWNVLFVILSIWFSFLLLFGKGKFYFLN